MGRPTRRSLLRTVAAGTAATAGAVALPASASASGVASAPASTVFDFLGRIDQDDMNLIGYGYVSDVTGVPDNVLWGHSFDRSEAMARLSVTATAEVTHRAIRGSVFVLDAAGTLQVHLLDTPGATFDTSQSFSSGKVVAEFSADLKDVLTVIAPNAGIPTLRGELRQTTASAFTIDGKRYRVGSKGTRFVLEGTGLAVRTNADPPRASGDLAARVSSV